MPLLVDAHHPHDVNAEQAGDPLQFPDVACLLHRHPLKWAVPAAARRRSGLANLLLTKPRPAAGAYWRPGPTVQTCASRISRIL